jgi:hypothetical protein
MRFLSREGFGWHQIFLLWKSSQEFIDFRKSQIVPCGLCTKTRLAEMCTPTTNL